MSQYVATHSRLHVVSPWYGKLSGRVTQPNPTEKNLSDHTRHRQAKRKRQPARIPQTKDPTKQATELLTVPLTTANKARILRVAQRCDPGIGLQLACMCEADQSLSMEPPRPVLLLEHCTGVATMMRNYRLAVASLLEQRHFITHWGARLSTYVHYVLRQHDRAIGRATQIFLAAVRTVCQGWQQYHAHAMFTVKEQLFMGQATAAHHHITHTLNSAYRARMLRTYRHAGMGAICSHATFLLGRHWQQIFNEYQREKRQIQRV